ncbi:MAG: MG2 domain-containing protein, partial [Ginsengibacter sp.]
MLDAIAKRFPDSEGGINSRNLINQIVHPQLNLTTEKVNVPELPFRTLVSYKNFNTVYFRILPLTGESKTRLQDMDNDKLFQKLVSEKNMREWKQELPATDDYLSHSAEVKINALPVGEYVLLGSASADFSLNKNPLAAEYFYVSNISFISSGQQYFVLDRTTGQPLKGARVQVYTQNYNYNTRNYELEKKELLKADEHGYFKLAAPKKNENSSVRLDITYKKDMLFLDDLQYTYNYYSNNDADDYDDQEDYDGDNAKVFLFTDRSIYRPGQLVYFKGIGITKNWKTKEPMLLHTKDSLTVYLYDANHQTIDSLELLLNEYGSFNGKFRLPENKLNGEFEIDVLDFENSSTSFSVEEYKRPKFYTEFEKAKGSYRVGDSVSIT